MRVPLAAFAFAALATPAIGQTPPPLDKTELIRLLTNPLFAQTEVADVVRRSCLTFHPTERDWADLRSVGAGGEVIATAAACESRRAPPPLAPAPLPPVTAVPVATEITTSAGVASVVRVRVTRGRAPQRQVALALSGSMALGLPRDAMAVTDDSGFAVFRLPAVARMGKHQLEIRTGVGGIFPGRPTVTISVRSAGAQRLHVTPDYVAFGRLGDSAATLVAAVTDTIGNPVAAEPVQLNAGTGPPQSLLTDSLGHATFVIQPGAVPRGGGVQMRIRGVPPVDLEVAGPAGLSGLNTGFVQPTAQRGIVASSLSLAFKARTLQGAPANGRVVHFRAVNARVVPESAILDTAGQARVNVVLGTRAGDAAIFGNIDSLEKVLTLRVDPGPIDSLILERNGATVNGSTILVPVAAPFVLRLRARDFYGNETSIDPLGQMLRAGRTRYAARPQDLQIVNLESADSVVVVTLKAQHVGTYNFTIGSGIRAFVRVEAVPQRN
ncbi:MAG: hypothetical protein AUI08_01715 [Gemmatimonadetes bacterium 13_2_20CM_2_65_7]|nr:MAG: hypothetical protein AUI08_01715 [Gemmatimonadetes bacterium 13_2_20CM_2_65_7]OLD00366.1 MAG: hypothetical protein AUI89_06905 [Gemmatimonadetes bacterium 13_1_40CM_3_65_8]